LDRNRFMKSERFWINMCWHTFWELLSSLMLYILALHILDLIYVRLCKVILYTIPRIKNAAPEGDTRLMHCIKNLEKYLRFILESRMKPKTYDDPYTGAFCISFLYRFHFKQHLWNLKRYGKQILRKTFLIKVWKAPHPISSP